MTTEPRTWSMPEEPGPEVTRVRDAYGQCFERADAIDEHGSVPVWLGDAFTDEADVDIDAIREPLTHPEALDGTRVFGGVNGGAGKVGGSARRGGRDRSVYGAATPPGHTGGPKNGGPGPHHDEANPRGRNPGDVWRIATSPFPEAHFAVMAPELARRCIVAGCKPGGVVLDPFAGSCTTGMVALRHGRRFVGIDLSATYLDLALRTRLAQGALIETEATP